MTAGVPAPPGWETAATAPGSRDTRWTLRASEGGCAAVYLYEARGPLKLDSKTTLPPAPRRVVVDGRGHGHASGWITDPGHLHLLATALASAAEWMSGLADPDPDAGEQLTLAVTEEAAHG